MDLSANNRIEQRVEVVDPFSKESKLLNLLKEYHKSRKNRILIFALYKKEAARLEGFLKRNGYHVAAIHGDLNQQQRSSAIEGFKNGSCPLLIATDVAARGIDIPNVEYVINVTFPLTIEDYCHRIGRTGRAGKSGISHTFFTVHDKTHSGSLINILKQANQKVPDELMKFGTTVKKKLDPNYGAFTKDIDPNLKPTKITFDDSDCHAIQELNLSNMELLLESKSIKELILSFQQLLLFICNSLKDAPDCLIYRTELIENCLRLIINLNRKNSKKATNNVSIITRKLKELQNHLEKKSIQINYNGFIQTIRVDSNDDMHSILKNICNRFYLSNWKEYDLFQMKEYSQEFIPVQNLQHIQSDDVIYLLHSTLYNQGKF